MWRKEGIFWVLSRVKVAIEPPISQKRDCNEKWLQPLTSLMNQCVHVLVTQLPQQRAGGSFFTGWTWECLQAGHTHTKIYEICNPKSIYTAGLEPLYIIGASQTSNDILHGFQVTHFFSYSSLPGVKMHLVITIHRPFVLITMVWEGWWGDVWEIRERKMCWVDAQRKGRYEASGQRRLADATMGKMGKQRKRLFFGNLPDGHFQHILF